MAGKEQAPIAPGQQPFLLSKLAPPRDSASTIERARLSQDLDELWTRRCSLVVAPAGFGKTTLLSHWYGAAEGAGNIAAWVTCDRADTDSYRFARHIVLALAQADRQLAKRLTPAGKVDLASDMGAAGISIVNAIETVGKPILLIVDDYHNAQGQDSNDFLSFLLNSDCKYLHLVVASREAVNLQVSRMRIQGKIAEFGVAELEFQTGEATSMLEKALGRSTQAESVEAIVKQTEGWATGLRLAAISLTENPDKPLENLLSGKEPQLLEYLREEVLSRLTVELSEFVRDTASLSELSAELADHIRNDNDSQALIDELVRRQYFLMPTAQPGWFRYHPLFVEAFSGLADDCEPNGNGNVNESAALWLQERGWIERALLQADLSQSSGFLLEMLSRNAERLAHTGRGSTLLTYARKLPAELLADHPDLQLDRVYAATLLWQFGEAKMVLDQVRRAMESDETVAEWSRRGLDVEKLEKKLIHREMQLRLLQDEMPQVESLALQWQSMPGGNSAFEDAVARTTLVYAQREMFNCEGVWTAQAAREIFEGEDNRWATIWHDCIIGATHAFMGNIERAERTISRAFHTSEGMYGRQSATTAMPALYLAELRYERNEIEAARSYVEEFLPLATKTGLIDQLIAGYQASAKIAAIENQAQAIKILERGEEVASVRQFERLRAILLSERIRMLTSAGENAAVRRIAKLNNLSTRVETLKPREGHTTLDAVYAFAAAHVAICENELDDAERLLSSWSKFLENRQCLRFAVRFSLSLAHAQTLKGQTNAAHRTIRHAIQMAGEKGFVRSFVDANPAIRPSLRALNFDHQPELRASHSKILEAIGGEDSTPVARREELEIEGGQYEALNDRESEILVMISTGMMNKQMAAELGLTLGTVKWYLQQIYTKMGVNRRSEAVFKARQLGLIN
ncbi:LuxR C-terminal-related transcriptional regulator [Qipengyuania sp.]|uniref:LuxR C-terminal-related transcriptional regulator n=1 Tax=Qipengyuania sp. TaxID=2004515 RepID=UPI003BAA6C31